MMPARISDPTTTAKKPENWDEARSGHCGDLAIRIERIEGTVFMRSAWEPTPLEALHLAAGGLVILGVSAPRHPVVHLAVEPAPEQLTRTTLIREQIDNHGNLLAHVETLFPPLPGQEGGQAHRAHCSVLIGKSGAPHAVGLAMAEIEALAKQEGWIPA